MQKKTLPIFNFSDYKSTEKTDSLLRIFEDVHNHIYANDGLSPEQALEEVIKLLFLKIYDEKNKKHEFKIAPTEYENVSNGKNELNFLNRFKDLQNNTFDYFGSLFEKSERIKLKNSTLGFVVNKLQNIDFLSSSSDVKGLAFQKFINSSQRVGRGQFFTPEQIVKLCVEILQPKSNEIILDPACGSGGFLSSSLQYVAINEPANVAKFIKNNIYGIEISKTAARIAKMRMILDGDGFSNIIQHDSLSDWSEINLELNKTNNKDIKTYQNFFDIILTNPPFGTQGKITDKSVLKNFYLGYKWLENGNDFSKSDELLNGQVPEILFIERCLEFLKPGGKMAIVLPNGDFENSSLSYLRNYIKEKANIFSIIKLPQETFIPSGTGVKTSILFLTKKIKGIDAPDVFFSQVTKLGYSGNKNGSLVYKKDDKGCIAKNINGDFQLDEDISRVVSEYLNFQKNNFSYNNDNSFIVNNRDLNYERFDFEFYKPSYRKFEKLLLNAGAKKLEDLVKIKKTKSNKLKHKDSLVRYVELSDVSSQYNEIINSSEQLVYELPSRASYELKEGEIITAIAGNSIGTEKHASAYVTKEYDGCVCTNGFRIFNVDEKKINPFYFLYFLRSKYFLDQIYRYRTGAAIPSIADSDLRNVLILLPSKQEQDRIGSIIKDGFLQRKKYQEMVNKLNFFKDLNNV